MPARAARRQRLVAGSSMVGDHMAIAAASTATVETPSSHARRCARDMFRRARRLSYATARSVPNPANRRRSLRLGAFFAQPYGQATVQARDVTGELLHSAATALRKRLHALRPIEGDGVTELQTHEQPVLIGVSGEQVARRVADLVGGALLVRSEERRVGKGGRCRE